MFAQLLGGIVGASLAYANYFHAITIYEGGGDIRTLKTAGLFAVYPVLIVEKGTDTELTSELARLYDERIRILFRVSRDCSPCDCYFLHV
jgi:hypothetical protein